MNQLATAEHAAVQAAALPGQYLTFMLTGETYAIGILAIKEIIEHGQVTRVPMMPACVRGVINLRGAVVPVVDLSVRFGGDVTAVSRRTCVVIVEIARGEDRQVMGILVDAVNEVLDIAAADIEPAPSFGSKLRSDFVAGMGRVGERFVIILDPEHVLAVEDLAALRSADLQSGRQPAREAA